MDRRFAIVLVISFGVCIPSPQPVPNAPPVVTMARPFKTSFAFILGVVPLVLA